MKTFVKVLSLAFVGLSLHSCQTEDMQTSRDQSSPESTLDYYVDKSDKVDFSDYKSIDVNDLDGLMDDLLENTIQEGEGVGNTFNLQPINDFLTFQGRAEIDVVKYIEEGTALAESEEENMDEFVAFLSKYNMYSGEQIDLIRSLNTSLEASANESAYDRALEDFKISVDANTVMTDFEKFTMHSFASLIKSSNDQIAERGACGDCIKKEKVENLKIKLVLITIDFSMYHCICRSCFILLYLRRSYSSYH